MWFNYKTPTLLILVTVDIFYSFFRGYEMYNVIEEGDICARRRAEIRPDVVCFILFCFTTFFISSYFLFTNPYFKNRDRVSFRGMISY